MVFLLEHASLSQTGAFELIYPLRAANKTELSQHCVAEINILSVKVGVQIILESDLGFSRGNFKSPQTAKASVVIFRYYS